MGILKGSLIHISDDIKVKIEELKIKDKILSLKKINGLLNYKYSGKSITLNHKENDFEYSNSHIYYQWGGKIDRYYIINDKLKITLDHVIYVKRDDTNTWDYVKSLKVGDKLLKQNLSFEEITKIEEILDEKVEIYNINLDGCFNYFCNDYLLHNAGVCDQDLSFLSIIDNGDFSNIDSLELPTGSCAYCGVDQKYFWLGPHRWDTNDKLCLPPPKYIDFNGDFSDIPLGLKAKGPTFVYRKMPKKWYDRSQLRINNRQLSKYYHIYLNTEGEWSVNMGSTLNDNMPEPTDITPHNLKGLFDNGSGSFHGGNTGFARFDSYHSYLSGGVRVLLDNSTDTNNWITYGRSDNNSVLHSAQTNQSGVILYGENTLDADNKGNDLDHWEKVRFCFTLYKTSSTQRTITGISFDGINTQSYTAAFARWRFVNKKGGLEGDPHPFSISATIGGYNYGDTNDNYAWGPNFFSISLDTLSE